MVAPFARDKLTFGAFKSFFVDVLASNHRL